jgi:hypothetical protein
MLQVEERPPTPFQRHVLRIIRACGPCGISAVAASCTQPRPAVELAVHLLRKGGFMRRLGPMAYDITAAGRCYLGDRGRQLLLMTTADDPAA